MMVNCLLDFVAVVIIVMISCFMLTKRRSGLLFYIYYRSELIVLLMITLLDIFTSWLINSSYDPLDDIDGSLKVFIYIANLAFVFLRLFFIALFTLYLVSFTRIDGKSMFKWRVRVYSVATATLLCLTWIVAYYGIRNIDIIDLRELPIVKYIQYAVLIYYLILEYVVGLRYRKLFDRNLMLHVMLDGLFLTAIIAGQVAFQNVRFAPFAAAIVMVDLIYAGLRPEEIFDDAGAMFRKYMMDFSAEDFKLERNFWLIFIRVNDYKVLAESFGVAEADYFMRQVVQYIYDNGRRGGVFRESSDVIIYRVSGNGQDDLDRAKAAIEKRFLSPWRVGTMETVLSADFMTVRCPEQVRNMKELVKLLISYDRKNENGDKIGTPEELIGENEDEKILEAVRRALENGGFQVFYQPIYSAKEKKITAAEALIRLFDPVYGYIPPEDMIKIAEREGCILEIGEIVFRKVCEFFANENLEKFGVRYVEVNLSAVQCAKSRLAEEFVGIMRHFNLGPQHINFEITETSAMIANSETVAGNIDRFEKNGISLSLDDYGTGYSNISYLYNMPFKIMKIDKSILWSAEKNPKADATLKNTYDMAKKLKLKVVQEGVETEEQIKKLLDLGCDYFQGYYFSKPVSGDDFIKYLKEFKLPMVCR